MSSFGLERLPRTSPPTQKSRPHAVGFRDGGGEPWQFKSSIRRHLMIRLFGDVA